MAINLNTPIIETKNANQVQVTDVNISIEREEIEVRYLLILEDGTPYQRGAWRQTGIDNIEAVYAEIDALTDSGKTFAEASTELAYSKALAQIES